MKPLIYTFFLFTITSSCENDNFCDCFFLRSELINQYEQASNEVEKDLIEKKMEKFDVSCYAFQDYTSAIQTEEELEEYQEKVRECQ